MNKETNKEEFTIKRVTITKPDGSKIYHEMLSDDYGFSIYGTITFFDKDGNQIWGPVELLGF